MMIVSLKVHTINWTYTSMINMLVNYSRSICITIDIYSHCFKSLDGQLKTQSSCNTINMYSTQNCQSKNQIMRALFAYSSKEMEHLLKTKLFSLAIITRSQHIGVESTLLQAVLFIIESILIISILSFNSLSMMYTCNRQIPHVELTDFFTQILLSSVKKYSKDPQKCRKKTGTNLKKQKLISC